MAGCDYRSCDVCGCKTFYDSNLDYDFKEFPEHGLSRLGDWKVICECCAEAYECVIVEKAKEC